ncbi:MAG: hypothetical protein H7268_08435 [Sandarakinorhabdus sp.]|nr:hypothetical protein [Sandarakinorhabdus sp.]
MTATNYRFSVVFAAAVAAAVSVSGIGLAVPAAAKQGDLLVGLRAAVVSPNESSGPVSPSFPDAGARNKPVHRIVKTR